MTTGEKIRSLRKKQNMSQEKLANIIGISRQAVSRWETENVIPETNIIVKLSEIFRVSTDYFLKEDIDELSEQQKSNINTTQIDLKTNKNLVIGKRGMTVAVILFLIVYFISLINPSLKIGSNGIINGIFDLDFWVWNDIIPLAIIIVISLIVGIYHLGKYYFLDYDIKE